MERKISKQVRGYRTKDGAGVSLVRVLEMKLCRTMIRF